MEPRVLIVDDHPAMQAGLTAVLRSEPGFVPVGAVETEFELWPALTRTRPDVVLLDYNLPDVDGLTVCRSIKSEALAPAVILYSAFADGSMTIPAVLAGADGILDKGVPPRELFAAIRDVIAGGDALPPISPEQLHAASTVLDDDDLPILGMLVERTPTNGIADILGLDHVALTRRIGRMLDQLTESVRPAAPRPRSGVEAAP
jgi:DNA-binding NarL/FixJ family response regulator